MSFYKGKLAADIAETEKVKDKMSHNMGHNMKSHNMENMVVPEIVVDNNMAPSMANMDSMKSMASYFYFGYEKCF